MKAIIMKGMMRDVLQVTPLKKPEIRVWMHPSDGGDDFYNVFETIDDAKKFIKDQKDNPDFRVEIIPLVAFDGYEMTWARYLEYSKVVTSQ